MRKRLFAGSTLLFFICSSLLALSPSDSSRELPGGPENVPAVLELNGELPGFSLSYGGGVIVEGEFSGEVSVSSEESGAGRITQSILLKAEDEVHVELVVNGSFEALAAETRGQSQENFPLVRTSHGLSNSLRNNAIYDRKMDWMLEAPEGTKIISTRLGDGTTRFIMSFKTSEATILFRPRYYQKHKNLPHYQPWTYEVYRESVTGWSSWWAFFREFTEEDNQQLLDLWQEKNFADYGYRFIQIDDVYQGGKDADRENCEIASGYLGGRPGTWLDWKKDLFPSGMSGYVNSVKTAGFKPAVWMGCFFSDEETARQHPGWFVQGIDGQPAAAPWVSYAMDATQKEVVDALIRPTFKGFKNAGVEYVKIDQLRHYLYDNLHNNLEWCEERGISPDEVLRSYLRVAREELGNETFILSCWGVLPESIGLADACRIGGDGYGPVTMQQYNSWNGIVWRNDPDHCDVLPRKKARGAGNVTVTESTEALDRESIIRPALASIAGAMLMLSDKPEVYRDNRNLYGLRRSSPVLFSVPGQLYDFDPGKTDHIINSERTEIVSGKRPSPIDGDQFGEVCPYWLNEFSTAYEHWNVLHRLNWPKGKNRDLEAVDILFSELGLDSSNEYLVYEFWTGKLLGVYKDQFPLGKLEAFGLESLAIREKLDRPQLLSTNRHLSQGAAEVELMRWEDNRLIGRSRMVVDDQYILSLYVPEDYRLVSATVDDHPVETSKEGNVLKIFHLPESTASLSWNISFETL